MKLPWFMFVFCCLWFAFLIGWGVKVILSGDSYMIRHFAPVCLLQGILPVAFGVYWLSRAKGWL